MNKTISEFNKHIKSTTKRKLTPVQTITEFYFWFKKLDKKFEPFTRHLKAAQKINSWCNSDLEKAFDLIEHVGTYLEERNLNYTLDTVHRNIPSYEKCVVAQKKRQAESDWHRQNTERLIKEYGYHKQPKNDEKDPDGFDTFFDDDDDSDDDDIDL